MHELALSNGLIEAILGALAERRITSRVSAVTVEVGRLTSVVPDSLHFYFGILRRGTVLEDAELQIETIALRTRCAECSVESEPETPSLLCSACGGLLTIVAGREFRLVSIDVAEEAA